MDKRDLHVLAKPAKFPVHVKQSHGDHRLDSPLCNISVTSVLLQLLPPFGSQCSSLVHTSTCQKMEAHPENEKKSNSKLL
jgi:hypothetical protein